MPLYCAAQWIVTQKGTKIIDSENFCVWESAYIELLAYISSGKITVTGIERDEAQFVETQPSEPREIVPGYRFSDCAIQCPYNNTDFDLALGDHSWLLRSFPYEDDDEWHGKLSDALLNISQKGWVQLKVSRSEVMTRWPAKSLERPHAGKPPTAALVIPEHERRLKTGEAKSSLGEEARYLATWFADAYPKKPAPVIGSIENAIREWRKKQVPQN